MEHRKLGSSGLRIPVLSFGTATFGGGNDFFKAWGNTQLAEAKKIVGICLDHGITHFDTANVYSNGASEVILGDALAGQRDSVLISTKATFRMSNDPNDAGSSRFTLIRQAEQSLKRLKTDRIDIFHMHGFDSLTPVEETLRALDDLITSGKIRYVACSNFSGWHLMKSLAASDQHSWARYVAHQAYYSLLNREFEWELMPLGLDQQIGTIVWSPLSAGLLTGKYRRGTEIPANARLSQGGVNTPATDFDALYRIVDILEEVAAETGKTITQVALNWVLQRPTVTSVIVGARTEEQLIQNLGAVGWNLTADQIKRLDNVSERDPIYPYWHQRMFPELIPSPDFYG